MQRLQNFKDRSLESKYNDISKFYSALNEFKNHKTNTDKTQQHKNGVINNAVALYNNYFGSYKKTFNKAYYETYNESTLDERKGYDPYQFKIASLLPEWLESKNDFNEARLIDDIRIDMNKVKALKEDKVFNDLNRLIIDINNNKVEKEDAVERLNKSISDLDQLKQKQSTAFQNKLIHAVYQLLNSFGFNKEFALLFSQIKSEKTEEERVKLKIESLPERSKSDTKEPTQLKQIDLNEMTKPLWIKLSRSDFASLIKDVVNNLDNKDYQTKINNDYYDLKNAEQFLVEIVTKKISKNEAHELYKTLIEPKVDKLRNAKGKGKDKRSNILIF